MGLKFVSKMIGIPKQIISFFGIKAKFKTQSSYIVLLEYQSGHDSYERYFGLSTDVSEVLHRWAEKHSHFKHSVEA